MQDALTITEHTLTEAKDIAQRVLENTDGHAVVGVALILSISKLERILRSIDITLSPGSF